MSKCFRLKRWDRLQVICKGRLRVSRIIIQLIRSSKIQYILQVAFHLYFDILRLISAGGAHGEGRLTFENHVVFDVVGTRAYILGSAAWDERSISRIDTCCRRLHLLILNFELLRHLGKVNGVLSRIEPGWLCLKCNPSLEIPRYGRVSDGWSVIVLLLPTQVIRIHDIIVDFDLDPLSRTRLMLYRWVLIPWVGV